MSYRLGRILFSMLCTILMCHDVLSKTANSNIAEMLHRPIRELAFPENSNMGIFVALSVPLEDPLSSISLSYFFEANYGLPANITFFEPWYAEGKRRRRSIDRAAIYRVLENKFESTGYTGRECLLRAICETSEFPLRHNGVIGDIVHVLFTFLWTLWAVMKIYLGLTVFNSSSSVPTSSSSSSRTRSSANNSTPPRQTTVQSTGA